MVAKFLMEYSEWEAHRGSIIEPEIEGDKEGSHQVWQCLLPIMDDYQVLFKDGRWLKWAPGTCCFKCTIPFAPPFNHPNIPKGSAAINTCPFEEDFIRPMLYLLSKHPLLLAHLLEEMRVDYKELCLLEDDAEFLRWLPLLDDSNHWINALELMYQLSVLFLSPQGYEN